MKVFIENEAGSDVKNIFNEETLEFKKAVQVSSNYPFPYGFVVNTRSGDGDCLDCFVITSRSLKSKDIVEAEIIGMFEQIEDGKEDHKILAILPGEVVIITEEIKEIFRDFVKNVFSHRPGKTISIGRFLGKDEGTTLLDKSSRNGV